MEYIISLKQKTTKNKVEDDRIGGKAASLMRMCNAGFPVPEGYVIPVYAWDNDGLKKEAKE